MNERIEKLLDQALEEFKAENKYATIVVPDPLQRDFVGKFAELIVQECAGVCAGIAAVRAGYNDVDGRDTAYSCGDTIKEYFGVE